ncbi:MAG: hypothetical protein JRI70_03930 [Deltaproteobacteria bacterium]|nr:hypothetical protein [Deltaproteobacteria bacterium]MBW2259485.1 hypothetical protein [Deltaproteobacteria bacterium]
MNKLARRLTMVFSAGCFGGLVNSLTLWFLGAYGVTADMGIKIAPDLTASWLYGRLVWGGLWGFLFVLPFPRGSDLLRGLLFSLGPSVVQLLVVFPHVAHKGLMGLRLGVLTPVLVLFLNALWGISTMLWLRFINEKV